MVYIEFSIVTGLFVRNKPFLALYLNCLHHTEYGVVLHDPRIELVWCPTTAVRSLKAWADLVVFGCDAQIASYLVSEQAALQTCPSAYAQQLTWYVDITWVAICPALFASIGLQEQVVRMHTQQRVPSSAAEAVARCSSRCHLENDPFVRAADDCDGLETIALQALTACSLCVFGTAQRSQSHCVVLACIFLLTFALTLGTISLQKALCVSVLLLWG